MVNDPAMIMKIPDQSPPELMLAHHCVAATIMMIPKKNVMIPLTRIAIPKKRKKNYLFYIQNPTHESLFVAVSTDFKESFIFLIKELQKRTLTNQNRDNEQEKASREAFENFLITWSLLSLFLTLK